MAFNAKVLPCNTWIITDPKVRFFKMTSMSGFFTANSLWHEKNNFALMQIRITTGNETLL